MGTVGKIKVFVEIPLMHQTYKKVNRIWKRTL
jgi:hypothetical protein